MIGVKCCADRRAVRLRSRIAKTFSAFVYLAGGLLCSQLWGLELPGFTVLENFEQQDTYQFPSKWRSRNDDAKKIYRIESESGNRFLRAHAANQAVQIGLEHIFDPNSNAGSHGAGAFISCLLVLMNATAKDTMPRPKYM
jgi:hypothetical protein